MVFGVEMLFGLVPFKTYPLFALMFVSPLSFFSVWFVRRRSFSFFLSLRRWGNPNPVWGLGFPLCSLLAGRGLRLPFPKASPPHLPFFFFSFVVVVRGYVGGWSGFVCFLVGWVVSLVLPVLFA